MIWLSRYACCRIVMLMPAPFSADNGHATTEDGGRSLRRVHVRALMHVHTQPQPLARWTGSASAACCPVGFFVFLPSLCFFYIFIYFIHF